MRTQARPIIIAIDGPAGSGKTTIARALAQSLGFAKVDTGAIYRTVGLLAERLGVALDDEDRLCELVLGLDLSFVREDGEERVRLAGEDVTDAIRRHEMSAAASKLSAWPKVRTGLLDLQRRLALDSGQPGAVLEGRDIGTVVFPDADFKFFLTATPEERARRRHQELLRKGIDVGFESILADQTTRDAQDSSREVAPLEAAADAIVFDSTGMAASEVAGRLEAMVREGLRGSGKR